MRIEFLIFLRNDFNLTSILVKNILRMSVIASDWLVFSAFSSSSIFLTGFLTRIHLKKIMSLLVWYAIVTCYTLIGFAAYPTDHVVKNSLFFFLIPLASILNAGKFFNPSLIDILIAIIVLQILLVVALHFGGLEVFHRKGWFTKALGFYTSGGTVVNMRFYSYNFTILMCLVFMRIRMQGHRIKVVDMLLIVFAIYLSGSKGIVLAAFYPFFRLITSKSIIINGKQLIAIISILTVTFLYFPLAKLIGAIFDPSDISNITRLAVTASLFDGELTAWGNGFGASLPEYLIRDTTRPYGFEISYVSYFHKLGFFFIIIMGLMLYLYGLNVLLLTLPIWTSALGNPTLSHLMNFVLLYLAVCTERYMRTNNIRQKHHHF